MDAARFGFRHNLLLGEQDRVRSPLFGFAPELVQQPVTADVAVISGNRRPAEHAVGAPDVGRVVVNSDFGGAVRFGFPVVFEADATGEQRHAAQQKNGLSDHRNRPSLDYLLYNVSGKCRFFKTNPETGLIFNVGGVIL
ncbi:hypothetical protein SDC9_186086 [bioreactor metagenome]|uniref:Uncharacterized protein n=1 Tax=bioreactor metagenome TaxID=1076179 RepID=A0A645HJJ5_9ZZZZ